MPFLLLFFVGGAVTGLVIGAGVAHVEQQNRSNQNERIVKRFEEEADSLDEAFELACDPLHVRPPTSGLERLLQHDAGLEELISEYHPRFRYALRRTCRSLNGQSQNGSKHKLSHLTYELYHAIFADLWELALPYIIAEASTTTKMIKLPLSLMPSNSNSLLLPKTNLQPIRCPQEEPLKRFADSYKGVNNPAFDGVQLNDRGDSELEILSPQFEYREHLTPDHLYGDFDHSSEKLSDHSIDCSSENLSDHSVEYVKERNAIFISFVILALHITYLIGRYLVNQQIPDWNELFYVIKEAFFSMFGAMHPLCCLALRLVFRLCSCQPLLPRSMQAWDAFNGEQEMNPVVWTWSVRFEVFVIEPLRIAMERGIGHLSSCYEDVMQLMKRFMEMSQDLFRRNVTVPFNEFARYFFLGRSTSPNPFLLLTLPFHPHNE